MKMVLLCFLLLLPTPLRAAATPQQTLAEANRAFQQAMASQDQTLARGLYEKALLRYEKLYDKYGSPELAYNMGNCYLRLGEIGHAIASYRRAAKAGLAADENLRHNLHYARSLSKDNLTPAKEDDLRQQLKQWYLGLDDGLLARLLVITYLAFWLTLALYLFKKNLLPAVVPAFLLFLLLLLATLYGYRRFSPPQPAGVVIMHEVVARQGNGAGYEPSFAAPLHDGAEFILLEKRGRWLHVRLPDSRTCWLPAHSCEII